MAEPGPEPFSKSLVFSQYPANYEEINEQNLLEREDLVYPKTQTTYEYGKLSRDYQFLLNINKKQEFQLNFLLSKLGLDLKSLPNNYSNSGLYEPQPWNQKSDVGDQIYTPLIQSYEYQITILKENISEYEGLFHTLNDNYQNLSAKYIKLQKDQTDKRAENTQLNTQGTYTDENTLYECKRLQDTLSEYETLLNQIDTEKNNTLSDNTKLRCELDIRNKKIEEFVKVLETISTEKKKLEFELTSYKQSYKRKEADYLSSLESNEKLKLDHKKILLQYDKLFKEKNEIDQIYLELSDLNDQLANHNSDLRTEISEKTYANEELNHKNEQLKTEIANRKADYRILMNECSNIKSQNELFVNDINSLRSQISTIKNNFDQLDFNYTKLTLDYNLLQKQYQDIKNLSNEDILKLNKSHTIEMEHQRSKYERIISDLKKAIDDSRNNIIPSESPQSGDNEKLKLAINEFYSLKDRLSNEYSGIEDSKRNLEIELESARRKVQTMEQNYSKLNFDMNIKNEELLDLKKDNQELRKAINLIKLDFQRTCTKYSADRVGITQTYKDQLLALAKENTVLKQTNTALQSSKVDSDRQYKQQLSIFSEQNQNLQTQVTSMGQQTNEYYNQNQKYLQLQKEYEQLRTKYATLELNFNRKSQQLDKISLENNQLRETYTLQPDY